MEQRVDDYYAILGLDDTASRAQIKAAYRDLAKTHHPDKKNLNKKTFGEIQSDLDGRRMSEASDFRLVQAAWETLSDADKRKQYDGELVMYRQEQAKVEKRQARERMKQQKKAQHEERRRLRKERREAELAAREAAVQQLAEMKAEEEFLENLYRDFGEDDSVAFELKNLKEQIAECIASDPELGQRVSNPELRNSDSLIRISNDPELEDITNHQTPVRQGPHKGRRNAEVWNAADPELDPVHERRPRYSPSTAHLMEEIDRAMKMRISQPEFTEDLPDCKDPEILA